ncbi:hypothetical protein BaRGS_00000369 [Batillaria attramentaria]|uniref:Uncharacterized protein n=1 Tax=Batillaria attramentaria TaxID=370345 RepID=A0ABD0M873_9CAEN
MSLIFAATRRQELSAVCHLYGSYHGPPRVGLVHELTVRFFTAISSKRAILGRGALDANYLLFTRRVRSSEFIIAVKEVVFHPDRCPELAGCIVICQDCSRLLEGGRSRVGEGRVYLATRQMKWGEREV